MRYPFRIFFLTVCTLMLAAPVGGLARSGIPGAGSPDAARIADDGAGVLAASPAAAGIDYPAPDFRTTTLAGGAQGVPFQLDQFRGSVVYVDFWASWCVPCRISFPALDQLHRKYRKNGFEVVAVNKDVAAADSARFLARTPVGFTLVADGDDAIARAYKVKAMPSGYLLDRKGRVRFVHEGFRSDSAAQIEAQILDLLKEAS
jgi:thiol-disulfide isomerase/thioredoxin